MFVPKGSAPNSDSQAVSKQGPDRLGAGSQQALRRQTSKLGAFRKSKLVARSPVREDSISPDLRALADSDRIPSPIKGGEYSFPLDVAYSPAAIFAQIKQRSPRRIHTLTSAYSPPQGARTGRSYTRSSGHSFGRSPSRCSPDNVANRNEEYCSFMCAPHPSSPSPCLQSFSRSLSLDMPSFQPMPLRQQQQQQHLSLFNDPGQGCRLSQASESTVIAVLDTLSQLAETDSQVSDLMSNESSSRIPCSPSQQTLGLDLSALRVYNDSDLYLDFPLPRLPRLDIDVFEASRAARRPYSEGFAEQAQMSECECAFCDSCDSASLMSTPSNQRAMYIRNSCADAGLVKSTFDLVKLLPSAPQ
ncbi:hypothetical protein GGI00_005510 [Coemansia sp. RSA 2681]|nr:hypothetical protein GGI00_005510 [Coemansia sp. RSA 2681]